MLWRLCCSMSITLCSRHKLPNKYKLLTYQESRMYDFPRSRYRCSSSDNHFQFADEEIDIKLKYIQLEISFLRQQGKKVPDPNLIKKHQWDELLKMKSKNSRKRFYAYLCFKEEEKENELVIIILNCYKILILTTVMNP